ncbi:hypothetical protein N658DRAFT_495479 [Parathielavia hyrcaniae]|uniref:Secreted protein n=1 Tax=Parathielavia hyrcaniae TaxID=113614 RepID=A0AAN6Q1Y9_9PEZI|nr:hypothetical protein N658DRAFT_495479 [Parathielavia hyrcaniae]
MKSSIAGCRQVFSSAMFLLLINRAQSLVSRRCGSALIFLTVRTGPAGDRPATSFWTDLASARNPCTSLLHFLQRARLGLLKFRIRSTRRANYPEARR